jgi:hypothetical protein
MLTLLDEWLMNQPLSFWLVVKESSQSGSASQFKEKKRIITPFPPLNVGPPLLLPW